jgi:hypothetical protein
MSDNDPLLDQLKKIRALLRPGTGFDNAIAFREGRQTPIIEFAGPEARDIKFADDELMFKVTDDGDLIVSIRFHFQPEKLLDGNWNIRGGCGECVLPGGPGEGGYFYPAATIELTTDTEPGQALVEAHKRLRAADGEK